VESSNRRDVQGRIDPREAPGMELRVSRVRLAAELRTASRTLRRGPMDRAALQGLAVPSAFSSRGSSFYGGWTDWGISL
jgi:hypothetical protein